MPATLHEPSGQFAKAKKAVKTQAESFTARWKL
jgi:hypothetical protein